MSRRRRNINIVLATFLLFALIFFLFTLKQFSHVSVESSVPDIAAYETRLRDNKHRQSFRNDISNNDHINHQVHSSSTLRQLYLSCPRNIHIVMIGDSLMRYQYLSLVYFLRWQQWFDPNSTIRNNLVNEKSWRRNHIVTSHSTTSTTSVTSILASIRSSGGVRHRMKLMKRYNLTSISSNLTTLPPPISQQFWNYFFRETNRLLNDDHYENDGHADHHPNDNHKTTTTTAMNNPFELCDCYRDVSTFRNNPMALKRIFENRYYHDPIRNNTVVYLLAYGHKASIHGRIHNLSSSAFPRSQRRNEQQQRQRQQKQQKHQSSALTNNNTTDPQLSLLGTFSAATWDFDEWHDVIQYYLAPLRPNYVVMNAGLWPNHFHQDANHSILLRQALEKIGARGMWRTTSFGRNGTTTDTIQHADGMACQQLTRTQRHQHRHDRRDLHEQEQNQHVCLNISWTRHVSTTMYWDHVHFLEPVYRKINEQMLELMGYLRQPPTTETAIQGRTASAFDQCNVLTKVKLLEVQ